MKDKTLIIIALLIFLTVGAFVGLSEFGDTEIIPSIPKGQTPGQISLQGVMDCLPHKGDGPHTMECASGLRVGEKYYGLDLSSLPENGVGRFRTDERVEVSGEFTPIEDLGDDRMTIYDIEGVIEVDQMTELE